MRKIKILALGALIAPAVAFAQVGPNPSVPGGSQSPSVGGSSDVMTAPQDAQIGGRATGNVLDRTIDTRAGVDVDTDVDRADTAANRADDTTTTGATISTKTRTEAGTKAMDKRRR